MGMLLHTKLLATFRDVTAGKFDQSGSGTRSSTSGPMARSAI
jgi:hypothetical protein